MVSAVVVIVLAFRLVDDRVQLGQFHLSTVIYAPLISLQGATTCCFRLSIFTRPRGTSL